MYDSIIVWVFDNKKWLFSGIGIVIITLIGRFFYKKRETNSSQTIRSGNKSTNLQAGRDISFRTIPKGNDIEEE